VPLKRPLSGAGLVLVVLPWQDLVVLLFSQDPVIDGFVDRDLWGTPPMGPPFSPEARRLPLSFFFSWAVAFFPVPEGGVSPFFFRKKTFGGGVFSSRSLPAGVMRWSFPLLRCCCCLSLPRDPSPSAPRRTWLLFFSLSRLQVLRSPRPILPAECPLKVCTPEFSQGKFSDPPGSPPPGSRLVPH